MTLAEAINEMHNNVCCCIRSNHISPRISYIGDLIDRDAFELRARTPFDRCFVVLIIGLIHHHGL